MSEIKVNKITPRVACGTTQLGDSGDTFTIPSGATITNAGTASGFGATGETSWDTTVKTTGTFTATAGVGYFLNTTGGTITVNLPVGAAGSSVALADYAGTWQTNNVTVAANGTEKIGGIAQNATLATEGQSVTFVYIDATQGWVNVLDSTSNVRGAIPYIVATGGTPACGTTCGDYKIHKFTGPGTFCVSNVSPTPANNAVAYMIVGGGGGGGKRGDSDSAGGGGAGGFREGTTAPIVPYTASPLVNCAGITVSVQGYPIVVGGGGTAGDNSSNVTNGVNSTALGLTGAGGGWGGCFSSGPKIPGGPGGSGGGSSGGTPGTQGTGNTPPTSPSQGTNGGRGGNTSPNSPPDAAGGGGGGATVVGSDGAVPAGAPGGTGATTSISGTPTAYAGGGGAGASPARPVTAGTGGTGGGGAGTGVSGTVNTGGGGGGSLGVSSCGGAGGSGIVIIRYKYQ